ncbi:efflux RND transporter periplasmic adaptor subunit [Alcaligenaceae bacterium]|nr:efflux RND transporter periplasmic adaptor subunit [Alcaligenaceae bacterium]
MLGLGTAAAQGSDRLSVPAMPPLPALASAPASGFQDPNAIRVLLSPQLETTLASQIVGRIVALDASLGAPVKAGQPLVSFDCNESEARLKMARAENTAARETLGVKQRLHKLKAAGDLEVSMARAEVHKSAAAIEVSQAQLAHCVVRAPFDGRVVKVHVKPHQGVNIGAPLVELVSDGPLKLRLNAPSRMLRQITIGMPIEVDILETGRSYVARVSAVNARIDAVAQTIELEASLNEAPGELLPGMSGIARLPTAAAKE